MAVAISAQRLALQRRAFQRMLYFLTGQPCSWQEIVVNFFRGQD
jgi:hypothetical protein